VILEGDEISGMAGAANQFASAFSDVFESGATAVVVADFVFNYGLAPATYTLDVNQLPQANGAAMITHSTEVYRWGWFEATMGDVVHLEATPSTTGNLDIAVINPGLTAFVSNRCTGFMTCATYDAFLQIGVTGRYLVRFFNTAATLSEGSPYTGTFATASQTPPALTLGPARPRAGFAGPSSGSGGTCPGGWRSASRPSRASRTPTSASIPARVIARSASSTRSLRRSRPPTT